MLLHFPWVQVLFPKVSSQVTLIEGIANLAGPTGATVSQLFEPSHLADQENKVLSVQRGQVPRPR